MPSDHKPITEAELKEMEKCVEDANNAESTKDWIGVAEVGVIKHLPRLIAEVRRLRAALEVYAHPYRWDVDAGAGLGEVVFIQPPEHLDAPGYELARKALGWDPPSEPCDNPSCDGVKEPDGHRCFKDGCWLDDGSEM